MIDQTVVITSNWLKDPVYGLQAMMASLPIPVLTPNIAIYNEMQDEELLSEEGPTRLPCVMVLGNADMEWNVKNRASGNEGAIDLYIVFAAQESAPLLKTKVLAGRVIRATAKSLKRLTIAKYREERSFAGVHENVKLVEVLKVTQQRVVGTMAGLRISNAVVAKMTVLDLEP